MKKIYLFIICFLLVAKSFSQYYAWAEGNSGYALASLKLDIDGNVYITGRFSGTRDFDPGPGIYNLVSYNFTDDIFVQKLDANGNLIWAKSMGGNGNDMGFSIAIDANKNVFIAGCFWATVDFDPSAATTSLTSGGGPDIFVEKLDSNGNFLWVHSFSGTGYEDRGDITLDTSGNVYTTGIFSGTMDFDPSLGTANLTSTPANQSDAFIQKMDGAGNFIWAKAIGGTEGDYGSSIKVDGSGNIYTVGIFRYIADFDPGAGITNLTSSGWWDIFIQKMDASGNFIWAKKIGGISIESATGIDFDAQGNVYTTGNFQWTTDFDPGSGVVNVASYNNTNDIFVHKMDANGNFLWVKSMGGNGNDNGGSIAVDGAGYVYITGSFVQTVDFDPNAGVVNLSSGGNEDIFIQKLDGAGNLIWVKKIGGSDSQWGNSIAIDGNQNIYIGGFFRGLVDFDPDIPIRNLNGNLGSGFVLKMSCCFPLAVEWISFTSENKGNYNLLQWKTATETHNEYFEIERSQDAISFEKIGRVQGTGNSNSLRLYEWQDEKPIKGLNYYRLKQVDINGNYQYSDITQVINTQQKNTVIYPNPSHDILYIVAEDRNQAITIYNMVGKIIFQSDIVPEKLDISHLSAEIYVVKINGEWLKFVKE